MSDKAEIIARIGGRRVIASVSGGKDSAAMSLYLTELGIEHDRVFLDTGWEHPATYEYLRGPLAAKLGTIVEVRGKYQMEELIDRRKMFPSRQRRYCTQELKVYPMRDHINAIVATGDEVLNAVGIRKAESAARAKMTEFGWSDGFDCEVWRPIIQWSVEDVIAIHQRHDLVPNPLYLKGARRVGCWPCIMSSKQEIRLMAEIDPGRVDLLRSMETRVTDGQRARYSERLRVYQEGGEVALSARDRNALIGADGQVRPFSPPAWFQAATGGSGECWPIDRVVEWSRTVRGGKEEDRQEGLFAGMNDGCMQWGLCETVEER